MVYTPMGLNTINTIVNTMVNKLKQGQKYQEGFTQKHILLKLCEKDKTSTTEILDFLRDQFRIREPKNVRTHLKKLDDGKLIKKDSAGNGHVDYWSVIPDSKVLGELVERFKYDPDLQHGFMGSLFYRSMIPGLVSQFANSFVGLELSMSDICNYGTSPENLEWLDKAKSNHLDFLKRHSPEAYGDALKSEKEHITPTTFTDTELDQIAGALKFNWSMLRFFLRYSAVDDDEKRELMLKVSHDANSIDALTRPKAASLDLVRDINRTFQKYDDETRGEVLCVQCDAIEAALAHDGEPPRVWFTNFFDQIENMRRRYPFLFD